MCEPASALFLLPFDTIGESTYLQEEFLYMDFSLCNTLLCEACDIRWTVLASQLFYTLAIRRPAVCKVS